MSSFTKCPRLVALPPDYRMFEVQKTFYYHVGEENSGEVIKIDKGFMTDCASIPKGAWGIIGGPLGKYAPATVVHDKCYRFHLYTRKRCDYIFYEAMQVLGVPFWKRWIMHKAVRSFGWIPWRKYTKKIKGGG